MQSDKTLKHSARKLATLSIENDVVSTTKVRHILKVLSERRPPSYRQLLRYYRTFLQRELRHRQALLEYAGTLSTQTVEKLGDVLNLRYKRPISVILREKPELLAGIRLSIGDDVYDASAAGRLASLKRHSVIL